MRNLIIIFLIISSVANANTITELQTEIKQKHGVEILTYGNPGDPFHTNYDNFKFFLEAFLAEADKQS